MSSFPATLDRHRKNLRVRTALLLGRLAPSVFARRLERPVFLIGCARSGTTLLAGMLGTHPQIAEWSEANYLWDPGWYPWRPEFRDKLPLEVDEPAFIARWWRENRHRRREIAAALGAYQTLASRPVLLNKSPNHTFRILQLLEMFPEARFIHMVRDGRAVAYSYAGHLRRKDKLREWPRDHRERFAASPEELVLHLAGVWSRSVREVEEQDRRLALADRGRLREVTYEGLVAEPRETLAALHRFLGVAERPEDPSRWRLRSQNHKWRQELSSETVETLERRLGDDLARRGYA